MRRTNWWASIGAALAVGCGAQASGTLPGGQSGTDGSDSTGGTGGLGCGAAAGREYVSDGYDCGCTPPHYAADQHIDVLSVSVDDLFELIGGTRTLPGEWTASGTPVSLTLDIQEIDGVTMVTSCGPGDFASVAHVTTSDGSVDVTATNIRLAVQQPAKLELEVPQLPAPLLPEPDGEAPPKLTIIIPLGNPFEDASVAGAILSDASTGATIGQWSSSPWTLPKPVPSLYAPPDVMASACANAPTYSAQGELEYTPLASADEARRMAIGTWVYCQQPVVTGTVGFRVAEDGSVRDLVVDGNDIVVRGGFGHEGTLSVFDTSAMNELPGLYEIGAGDFVGYFWQGALANSDHYGSELLLQSSVTFPDAPKSFQPFERAGTAACGVAESGVVSPTDSDAARGTLAGSWTRCSGSLPNGAENFVFDASSATLTFQDTKRQSIDESTCDLIVNAMTGNVTQLDCYGFKSAGIEVPWNVEFVAEPLMAAVSNGRRRAVFSALP